MRKYLFAAFLIVSPCLASAASVLYGSVRAGSQYPPQLYSIDSGTGVTTELGNPMLESNPKSSVSGLAYIPSNNALYGVAQLDSSSQSHLAILDRTTGEILTSQQTGIQGLYGIAYDSFRDELFGVSNYTDGHKLYTINPLTGLSAYIADLNIFGESFASTNSPLARELAYDSSNNRMYISLEGVHNDTDVNGLGVLDVTNGSIDFIGTYKGIGGASNLFNNVRAIAFDTENGRLVGTDIDEFGALINSSSQLLLDINTSTGEATPFLELDLTWDSSFRGLEFAAVPIPPAIWLFASGLIGLIGLARRKSN